MAVCVENDREMKFDFIITSNNFMIHSFTKRFIQDCYFSAGNEKSRFRMIAMRTMHTWKMYNDIKSTFCKLIRMYALNV